MVSTTLPQRNGCIGFLEPATFQAQAHWAVARHVGSGFCTRLVRGVVLSNLRYITIHYVLLRLWQEKGEHAPHKHSVGAWNVGDIGRIVRKGEGNLL